MVVIPMSAPYPAPFEKFLGVFKNRWTPLVLLALAPLEGVASTGAEATNSPKLRRKEIKARLPQLSDRILTDALRDLERKKLIERRILSTVPQGVEYWLTPAGHLFIEPFRGLEAWCDKHHGELKKL